VSSDFQTWWDEIGSGIRPLSEHDYEQHGRRITMIAWNDSSVRCTAELARLRAEIAALTARLVYQQGEITRLRAEIAALKACIKRKDEVLDATIRNLRTVEAERDGARREYCDVLGGFCTTLTMQIAEHRGWDCFTHANTTDVPVQNGGE
jgi:hypothetical protein